MPLSTSLGRSLLALLEDYGESRATDPEVQLLRPLLDLQSRLSAIPTSSVLLVETLQNQEGFHLFVYPFAGRMLNEGVATLMSLRAARESPRTFSITTGEYGFELLCAEPFDVTESALRRWAAPENLISDLLASMNASDLSRRQFRDIARIAGLVDPGSPRRGKTTRQLQASSGLMFDVLQQHDPENLLLEQSQREVLDAQLDCVQMQEVLEQMQSRSWQIVAVDRLTPLSFPLWADRLQTQILSTESWQRRIEREARRLEGLAR